jgi:hypothetical protein
MKTKFGLGLVLVGGVCEQLVREQNTPTKITEANKKADLLIPTALP